MNRSLFIIDATGEESRFDMTQETLIVGRDTAADLTLQDNRISRRHLCLTQVSNDIVVEDLKSSNGTTLNGEAFEGKRILKSGDRLDLGGIQIHIDLVRGTGNQGVPDKSTRRTKSPIPVALMILAVAAVATYSLKQTEPMTPSASTPIAESPPGDSASADINGPTVSGIFTGTGAGERFVTDRKLADARVDLRLMVEESILEEDLPSASQALERFEKLHGARTARTARSHLIAASTALLNRSLSEWQLLQIAFSADDRQAWLANKERSFPQRSTDFAKLRDAVISWAANPIPTTSTQAPAAASNPVATSTPESNTRKPNPTVAAAPHASLIKKAAEQESARRFASAAELWKAALKAAQLENTGRRSQLHAKAQARRLTLQASAIDSMTRSINRQPDQFANLRCLSRRRGNAVRATKNGVDFLVGEKPITLTWKAIRNECLVDIIRRCKLTTSDLLPCAQLLLSMQQDERAHKFLQNAVENDAALLRSVGQLLSDHLGMDLPTGDFCWIEGRYLSPREARRVATRTSIIILVADIASDDENERRSAAEKLFALGASAQSTFHRALMEEKQRIFKAIEGSKTFQRLETMGGRATELRTRRRSVLDLVFDKHLYPYPYRGVESEVRKRYQETQQKIDELKVGVREIWDATTSVRVGPNFRANLARVSELNQWLESLELGRGGNDPEFLLYLPSSETVNIRTFALDDRERERIDDSLLAMTENATRETAASVSEARQVEITNIYRVMMGRRAVRIHDILTRSVRGHCEDMARLGFFGHMNDKEPEKRTPSDRARLMGFNGGVSENLAISGGAQSAHNGWIHSSGHHRNILGLTHRIMGAGNSGRRWGQVFSGQIPERLAPDDDIEDADDDS